MSETYNNIFKLLEQENLINKELSFGCEVYLSGIDNKYSLKNDYDSFPLIIRKDYVYQIIFQDEGNGEYVIRNNADCIEYRYLENGYKITEESYEIIGHPPTILSILEWFNKKGYATEYYCGAIRVRRYGQRNVFTDICINISNPELRNQSEEVLESLYNLMESLGE